MAIEIAQNLDAINMVRAQQNVVGRSIIGGAGAVGGGNLIGQGEQTDILTSIQLISEKTFKAIKQQTDTLVKILEFITSMLLIWLFSSSLSFLKEIGFVS